MATTTDTTTIFSNLNEARDAIVTASASDPSSYFWISNCFGWVINSGKRLPVNAPSDGSHWSGMTASYWKGGKERNFSEKQRIADQNATPMMS